MNNLSYYFEGSLMAQFSDLRLIEARRLAGFNTRAEVVRRFGWCRSTYDAHENGMSNFNFVTAEKYAQAFNVSAHWLYFGEMRLNPKIAIDLRQQQIIPTIVK